MLSMELPSSKRQTSDAYWNPGFSALEPDAALFDHRFALEPEENQWQHVTLHPPTAPIIPLTASNALAGPSQPRSARKRAYEEHDEYNDIDALQPYVQPVSDDTDWAVYFPNFHPSLPAIENRHIDTCTFIFNPFSEVSTERHKLTNSNSAEKPPIKVLVKGAVNSYLKFQAFGFGASRNPSSPTAKLQKISHNMQGSVAHAQTLYVPGLPPGFGKNFKLDATDNRLFDFYLKAMCSGRTLLHKTNGWQNDLAPMADCDEGMHHALLAFAAGYALDYQPNNTLRKRANEHYQRAVEIISEKLQDSSIREIGKEDTTVGALRLLWCDDIVQWEMRRDKSRTPRWFEAAQVAKSIMAVTDPGYRYWHPTRVQQSSARLSNANMLGFVDIMAHCVRPLNSRETESCHPWLLEGSEKECRRIYGGTGLSPKLLHMFGQITHICARMVDDPHSTILPLGAKELERKLNRLHQWSEISEGHASLEALLQSCHLDDDGFITTAEEATELGGQAWIQTARLYQRFRFFRYPRSDSSTEEPLSLLRRILERLPCSGPLFTSQSPFFPVFMMGLASTKQEDRAVARKWFETVTSMAGARSNVPPIWRVLQETWQWMDSELIEYDENINDKPIGERLPWWELLVERFMSREGILSIV
ncbi:hypothetical protein BT63DRAFT_461526 [Microthyrium microscopicum]|uniref:Uncharacterized protein n=1 Tax=Microthyrium microscopicum TaxID=703497 RepID=A0A6A6TWB2_9PEZI|nr:hypothetical protein BT63DRAFT_461526 [Microthyrium microscopicum]